jgi:hypothetical protein
LPWVHTENQQKFQTEVTHILYSIKGIISKKVKIFLELNMNFVRYIIHKNVVVKFYVLLFSTVHRILSFLLLPTHSSFDVPPEKAPFQVPMLF